MSWQDWCGSVYSGGSLWRSWNGATLMGKRQVISGCDCLGVYRYWLRSQRIWECAERKTRGSSGIDGVFYKEWLSSTHVILIKRNKSSAVAVLAVLSSKTNAFPKSTVVIEQYRPPIDRFIIGDYLFWCCSLTHLIRTLSVLLELPAGKAILSNYLSSGLTLWPQD